MAESRPSAEEPLTPTTFHVLIALGDGPLHGYGVMRRVEEDSGIQMGPGTVYGALNRLQSMGWVQDAGVDQADARRGRRFSLTRAGRKALETEALRIQKLAALTRKRRLLPGEGR
jgi:DNA-binding PadR family transcriptional regulator